MALDILHWSVLFASENMVIEKHTKSLIMDSLAGRIDEWRRDCFLKNNDCKEYLKICGGPLECNMREMRNIQNFISLIQQICWLSIVCHM